MPAPRPHSRWGTALFVLSLMQTSRRAEGILQIQPHLELVELLPLPAELWEKPRRQVFRRDRRFPSLSLDRIHRGTRSATRGRSAYAGALRREYLAARGRTHDGLIMVRREHLGSPFQVVSYSAQETIPGARPPHSPLSELSTACAAGPTAATAGSPGRAGCTSRASGERPPSGSPGRSRARTSPRAPCAGGWRARRPWGSP